MAPQRGLALAQRYVTSSHGHNHGADASRRALRFALALIAAFLVAEVVAGIVSGSLALLADAGHMLTDAAALALALFALNMAQRPATGRWTFGFKRTEILAAQANGVALVAIGAVIVLEAVQRLSDPPEVEAGLMLAVALAGVAVNLVATAVLHRSSRASLNMQGAYRHIATDLAAFVGTAVAAVVILTTGWLAADPVASLLVAALIFATSWGLLRDSTSILMEAAPEGLDPGEIGRAMAAVPGVLEVHDLHVWTVTSGFPALAAHVTLKAGEDPDTVRRRIEATLRERFELDHTTIQLGGVSEPQLIDPESLR